jgi:diguanylate cyclase (GGDEF)-like protein
MPNKKAEQAEALQFIRHLNRDIKRFIADSIETPEEAGRAWSTLGAAFRTPRCWKIKGCAETSCPAHEDGDYRCWLQSGTACDGSVQGHFTQKYRKCFACEVFRSLADEPLRELYENIDILIFHLQERARRFEDLAIRDALTGLYNRHFFNEVIERELAAAERRQEPLSFIMIDMDDFKEINDRLGHPVGDELLVEAAWLIRRMVRKSDLVFRYGGDELLVLMTNADAGQREAMTGRISAAVDAWNLQSAENVGCRMSFSIGSAGCTGAADLQNALQEADRMMYENKKLKSAAKKRGRRPAVGA